MNNNHNEKSIYPLRFSPKNKPILLNCFAISNISIVVAMLYLDIFNITTILVLNIAFIFVYFLLIKETTILIYDDYIVGILHESEEKQLVPSIKNIKKELTRNISPTKVEFKLADLDKSKTMKDLRDDNKIKNTYIWNNDGRAIKVNKFLFTESQINELIHHLKLNE